MRYSLRGWNPIAGTEHAEGLEELVARGWTRIYRAPQGEGVERRASFAALDLRYGPELHCRCAGVGDAVEESKSDVSLRFRWERGRLRFYDVGDDRFEPTDNRRTALARLSQDLGLWAAPLDGAPILTAVGGQFIAEVFG